MSRAVPWREGSLALLVAALLAIVALGDLGGSSSDATAGTGPGTSSPTARPSGGLLPTATAKAIDTDTFCTSYATMADAYGAAVNATTDAAVEKLRSTAIDFISVGTPPGMGVMEDAGRLVFVEDMLGGFGQPVQRSDQQLASAQLSAFSGLLTTACPGY